MVIFGCLVALKAAGSRDDFASRALIVALMTAGGNQTVKMENQAVFNGET